MPSLRHRAVAAYVALVLRRKPVATDEEAAAGVRARRPRTPPSPPARVARTVEVETDESRGWPVYTLRPAAGSADGPTVLYLHGGAYVSDIDGAHWAFAARLVARSHATVVLPRYPLAPESSWRDSRDALLELARGDAGAGPAGAPVLMGDSAGGGLALALAQASIAGSVRPPSLVLIAPWVDLTMPETDAALEATRDPWLRPTSLRQMGRLWAAGDDPTRPELSPARGELGGLPPTLVVSGTRDVLHPQAVSLVRAITDAGGDAELVVGDGLIHVYPILPVPEAAAALEQIAAHLAAHPG